MSIKDTVPARDLKKEKSEKYKTSRNMSIQKEFCFEKRMINGFGKGAGKLGGEQNSWNSAFRMCMVIGVGRMEVHDAPLHPGRGRRLF